jgi:hypothetical protein
MINVIKTLNAFQIHTYSMYKNNFLQNSQQEEIDLLQQASIEEQIMTIAPQTLLSTIKDVSVTKLVNEMQKNGVFRVDSILSTEVVNELLTYILHELSLARDSTQQTNEYDKFSSVLSPNNRWDLKLPFSPPVEHALRLLLRKGTLLGDTLSSLVGDDAELFELASFVTINGAGRQVMHADTLWSKLPCLYTCTIALQDITPDMGPTVFMKGSHTKQTHRVFDKKPNSLLESTPHCLSTLSLGSAALYDSRTLHCGGANKSNKQRALFYFTFANPEGMDEDDDSWNVASIRNENKGKYKLRDFR